MHSYIYFVYLLSFRYILNNNIAQSNKKKNLHISDIKRKLFFYDLLLQSTVYLKIKTGL